jgi:hypothetical protein
MSLTIMPINQSESSTEKIISKDNKASSVNIGLASAEKNPGPYRPRV